MFGWEFPPYNSGGLGVACLGLTTALARNDLQVLFVLPKKVDIDSDFVDFEFADIAATPGLQHNIQITAVNSLLQPYQNTNSYVNRLNALKDYEQKYMYGDSLMDEVMRYGMLAEKIALTKEFDVIHAHDWLSYPAGMMAKAISGKPFIAHIHATEFDRTGGHVNEEIYKIEQEGMQMADQVVAVSELTRQTVINQYGIPADKVVVVHNGIDLADYAHQGPGQPAIDKLKKAGYKIVLFVGRMTMQKGPEYLLQAAARVASRYEKVKFVIAGSGDMEKKLIELSAELGLTDKVIFPGFLRGAALSAMYKQADVFVMPSVSEPFGLVALEAVANHTPIIVSKQSGVAEVVDHAFKVDFWDVQAMADAILGIFNYGAMFKPLTENGYAQASTITWDKAAVAVKGLYQKLLAD
jgi:glycogen(starch) synthase